MKNSAMIDIFFIILCHFFSTKRCHAATLPRSKKGEVLFAATLPHCHAAMIEVGQSFICCHTAMKKKLQNRHSHG